MYRLYYLLIQLLLVSYSVPASATGEQTWYALSEEGRPVVNLYVYWSKKCPHCLQAMPFIEQLDDKYAWLKVFSRELSEHPEHIEQFMAMAAALKQPAQSVPSFIWCGRMFSGYDKAGNTGRYLEQSLISCYQQLKDNGRGAKPALIAPGDEALISIPLLGSLSLTEYSLPVYTVILAGIDAFNPCAFFILLFLLSLLVHAKSRKRMIIVGGVFVLFSGLMYFLFMSAWLNVFLIMGNIDLITSIAGLVAVVIASINIKDYFWFKRGVSLSIPESVKPGLYRRTRRLIVAGSLPTMIIATMGLAVFANLYEFLCTAGFPMVYTRILTMSELTEFSYYLYLVFYNVIYIIPLLVIVVVFSMTLGMKKLQEKQGQQLKLLSGCMMLVLGLVLVLSPGWLNNALTAVGILFGALLLSLLLVFIKKIKQG